MRPGARNGRGLARVAALALGAVGLLLLLRHAVMQACLIPTRSMEAALIPVVPPGPIFVMGGCRDVADDSRRFGPVPPSRVEGRAVVAWWSRDPQTGRTRWARVGWGIE